jgi:hypothetical protein
MADLSILKQSGMDLSGLPEEELAALGRLDESELQALASIRGKLNSSDEVEGFVSHRKADSGNLVW